jgi:hypothetical protein
MPGTSRAAPQFPVTEGVAAGLAEAEAADVDSNAAAALGTDSSALAPLVAPVNASVAQIPAVPTRRAALILLMSRRLAPGAETALKPR